MTVSASVVLAISLISTFPWDSLFMPGAEFRTDHWSGRQVIIASNRSDRPQMVASQAPEQTHLAPEQERRHDPFLEGREHNTPQESLALRQLGSQADGPGWLLRVVANRYPAVAALAAASGTIASGIHDVVIECPDFRRSWLQFSNVEVLRVLIAWQQRLSQLIWIDGIECIQVFRNQGAAAGASLGHSHSQIVALNCVPRLIAQRLQNSDHFHQWRSDEVIDGERIVSTAGEFLVACPEASWLAGQMRICPTANSAADAFAFHQLPHEATARLANVLCRCVTVVQSCFPGVSFNLILNLAPVKHLLAFPWSIDIMPRTASFAGFELGCDVPIVTRSPEAAAEAYRTAWRKLADCFIVPTETESRPSGYAWVSDRSTS